VRDGERRAESCRRNDGIERGEIREGHTGGIGINTYGDGDGGTGCGRAETEGGWARGAGTIAREIRASIGGGGYQRNKGTARGKVRAISAEKSLVKGVEGGVGG